MQDTIQAIDQTTTKRYQCRHIFTDGHRCGSPCLRHEEFCYYHHTTRRPVEDLVQRRSRQSRFDLPLPEDRSAIQCSIGEVLRRIASNEIDSKRAGLLLYGLQIASLNLPRIKESTRDQAPIEEIVTHPSLGTLAPRTEVAKQEERESPLIALLRKSLAQDKAEAAAEKTAKQAAEQAEVEAIREREMSAAQAAKEEDARATQAEAAAHAANKEAAVSPETQTPAETAEEGINIVPTIQASEELPNLIPPPFPLAMGEGSWCMHRSSC
jgi:hypothetical protein